MNTRDKPTLLNMRNTLIVSGAAAGVLFFVGVLLGGLCRLCCHKKEKQDGDHPQTPNTEYSYHPRTPNTEYSDHPQTPNTEEEDIYDNIHERMATAIVIQNNDAFQQDREVEFVLQNNPAY